MSVRLSVLAFLMALEVNAPPGRARAPLRVVIDPGHGGTNLGAHNPSGVLEKDVTLVAARLLGRELSRRGVEVRLTRTRDQYLSLAARVREANTAQAHLLISLHCNASPRHDQQGYEAFVAPPEAARARTPVSSRASLAPEAFLRGAATRLALARALGDLRAQTVRHRSILLGRAVMHALRRALGPRGDRGLRQAPFDVLLGAKMPALLVEMGFLDHRTDGRRLLRRSHLRRIARALAEGILAYARQVLHLGWSAVRQAGPTPSRDVPPFRRRDRRRPPPIETIWQRPKRPQVAFEPAA